jgi:hypothetical protein
MMRRIASLITFTLLLLGLQPLGQASGADINFTTPSKNIDCLLFDWEGEVIADCLVEQATWKNPPKRPTDCDLDWIPSQAYVSTKKVGTKIVNSVGVGACRGDIGPLCIKDGCTVLAYGKTVKRGSITCTSATTGVTCITTAGPRKGFTVSRASYTLFK